MTTSTFLEKILIRLKQGDARSIHLNAIPGNFARLDIYDLINIEQSLHHQFLENLLTKRNFKFSITIPPTILQHKNAEEKKIIQKLIKKLNHLDYQDKEGYAEHGYHAFGFGYPLLIKRDPINRDRILKAPLLIWYLKIEKDAQKNNTWTISRDDEHPLIFNELLQAHVESNEKITTQDLDVLLEEEFVNELQLKAFCKTLMDKLNTPFSIEENIATILPCTNKETIESITKETPWVRWSGVFGLYKVQKQSIIKDMELLEKNNLTTSSNETEFSTFDGEILTPITLDPSQENVLFQLKNSNNIIIQGPPGTGKSQSLTAVITQALLNKQKVLVVCEKRTAMEVLYNNLKKENLHHLCVLIEDVYTDRKSIVENVRDIIENIEQLNFRFKENEYETLRAKFLTLQEEINHRINLSTQLVFGDNTWTELLHRSLILNEDSITLAKANELNKIIRNHLFQFDFNEFVGLQKAIQTAIPLHQNMPDNKQLFEKIQTNKIQETTDSDALFHTVITHHNASASLLQKIEQNTSTFQKNYTQLRTWRKYLVRIMAFFSAYYKQIIEQQKATLLSYIQIKNNLLQDKIFTETIEFTDTLSINDISELKIALQKIQNNTLPIKENAQHFEAFFMYQKFVLQQDEKTKILLQAVLDTDNLNAAKIVETYYINQVILKICLQNGLKEDTIQLYEDLKNTDIALKQKLSEKIRFIWQDAAKTAVKSSDITALKYLYNQRKNKQFASKNSLRKIIHQDFEFFTNMFPVVMVNPSVSSSILPLQKDIFDFIILDEASQLRLEDTYSSLIRGKIKVISGDRHQMPPSNFFGNEVIFYSDEEAENNNDDFLAESKSLLEYADDTQFKSTYLDFHYRSKHPDLIGFSNHAFYQSRLIPMPQKQAYQAIYYNAVNGIYTNGTNVKEAEEIVQYIYTLQPENNELPSIGIATFNIYQRDLILDKLYEAAYADKHKNEHLQALLSKGLFVKNLENIQGDERDIMLLSTTFGADENGKFRQAFGPINQEKGYQLLNVIITRAKQALHVYTSIPETIFMKYETDLQEKGNTGKGIFYAYLAFVKSCAENNKLQIQALFASLVTKQKTSNIQHLKSNPDDIFRQYIYEQLKKHLGDSLQQNQTFGGFHFDLAWIQNEKIAFVFDFENSEMYHSEVAYRKKLHQQDILQQYNIHTYHIWALHWWKDKDAEIQKILEHISKF